ncbi:MULTISPECIES: transposase [unclassified Aeribacillus]|uniref:transposase n=1 Tax=unclassified Aeribacillus TaxID=2640495 RepID=UPI0030CE3758
MKSVIAFDVSMGKSYMVIYNAARSCIFEGEILHNRPHFELLNKRIIDLVQKDGQVLVLSEPACGIGLMQLWLNIWACKKVKHLKNLQKALR